MMQPEHHICHSVLMASSSGTLSPGLGLIAACHAVLCSQCGREHAALDDMGGALLLDESPAAMDEAVLHLALARLDGMAQEKAAKPPVSGPWPMPLAPLVERALERRGWTRVGIGIRTLTLEPEGAWPGETLELMRIEPHCGAPRHGHKGAEWTLVLQGLYEDHTGRYRRGDVAFADENLRHAPRAGAGDICYALAVTTGPLQFTGMTGVLQRLANQFSRK